MAQNSHIFKLENRSKHRKNYIYGIIDNIIHDVIEKKNEEVIDIL